MSPRVLATATATQLTKLIPRLGSDQEGEVVATVSAIRRLLRSAGLDLHDLAAAVQPESSQKTLAPPDAAEMVRRCLHYPDDLTPKEAGFLRDMQGVLRRWPPTEKQLAWLVAIHGRLVRS